STVTLPPPLTAADVQSVFPGGQPVSPDQAAVELQVWRGQKKNTRVIDEFRLIKEIFTGNNLTMGLYAAHYTMNDNWSLSSNVLVTNVPNARPIIMSAIADGNLYQVSSPQGIVTANGGYNILQNGRATNVAPYLSDSWRIGRWLVDVGVRGEHINLTQETSNLHRVQMGSQFDLWNNSVSLPDCPFSPSSANHTFPTYSGGVNYEFSDHMSAYFRANTGVRLPNFDDVRCNINTNAQGVPSNGCPAKVPLQTMRNYEFGFKI